jgi:hypothetical protein
LSGAQVRASLSCVKWHPSILSQNLGVAVLVLGLTSCNSGYRVKVDSMSRPQAEPAIAYQIKTNNPELDPDSLRYKEAERFVKTALSGKGLYEAPKPEMADMVVNLDYGISPPKVSQEMRREPIFATIPGAFRTELVQVGVDKNGNPIYSTITVQEPSRTEYIGDREYMETVVTYEKYLRLTARENKPTVEGQPPSELWTVDVSTEGENRDLRKALPVLAAATIEYVSKDSQGQKTIKLKDTDKNGAIAFVKKGL